MNTDMKRMVVGYLVRDGERGPEAFMGRKTMTASALKLGIADKIIGYGGKRDPEDASDVDCIVREFPAETRGADGDGGILIAPEDAVATARLVVKNEDGRKDQVLTCFVIRKWSGTARDSNEIVESRFYPLAELPREALASDHLLLADMVAGKRFAGWIKYDAKMERIVEKFIYEVDAVKHE